MTTKLNLEQETMARAVLERASADNTPHIDLANFDLQMLPSKAYSSEQAISQEMQATMAKVGLEVNAEKSGIYLQEGNSVDLCVSKLKGVELLPIQEALIKYDGTDGKLNLQDYLWKAVPVDKDQFTADVALQEITQGYFIYARKGVKTTFPLQSCLFVDMPGLKQVAHNIIIAEEGSELDIITG